MALVSVTRLRVRLWRYLPAFLVQSFRVVRQAKRAEGNLAASVLRDANLAFWTRTLWRDEAVMRSFMGAGAHQRVSKQIVIQRRRFPSAVENVAESGFVWRNSQFVITT